MTIIHAGGNFYTVTEALEVAQNRFKKAVSRNDALIPFTTVDGTGLYIVTSQVIAIDGRKTPPSELAARYVA